ncbi:MAG: SDR family NAD(P)-dependent oxidoreductase, partial [Verrucomicrobiales bacterium]|nr:SDR family NAD(P)-dependent oxidoreductase [Verrucomicrobiales bacterium]
MRLQGKTAIITGAGSGIGLATVRKFLAEGAQVFATDINESSLESLVREFPEVAAQPGDVSQPAEAEALVAAAMSKWGRLDILVNSAGITARNVAADASLEER